MPTNDTEYSKAYYQKNKERMIETAKRTYERHKTETAYCEHCDKTVKKLGWWQHCQGKKHLRLVEAANKEKEAPNDVSDHPNDTDNPKVYDYDDDDITVVLNIDGYRIVTH